MRFPRLTRWYHLCPFHQLPNWFGCSRNGRHRLARSYTRMEVSIRKSVFGAAANISECLTMWHIFPERYPASSTTSMVGKHGNGLDGWWDRPVHGRSQNRLVSALPYTTHGWLYVAQFILVIMTSRKKGWRVSLVVRSLHDSSTRSQSFFQV
jgi:hypothetical protein